MKLLDTNLLLYAVNADAPLHQKAKSWLEGILSDEEPIALSWIVMLAFLRLATRPGLFRCPLRPEVAFECITEWLAHPNVRVVNPGPGHIQTLRLLLTPLGTAANLTSDAHLAALAIEHGAELCSCDSDFSRFPGLNWRNPSA